MARFKYEEADNYGGGNNSFFALQDDRDTAIIRFLYNDMNDVEGVSCHTIKVDGKDIDVECLRKYDEPIENCPLCREGHKINAKLFVPVYNTETKESLIWTRGKTFFKDLSSLCSRYNPLVGTPIEVERQGKKGDTSTKYVFYPTQSDNSILSDFPEVNAEGSAYQIKTYDELENYLETGSFDNQRDNYARRPNNSNQRQVPARQNYQNNQTPVRRRPNYDNEENSF